MKSDIQNSHTNINFRNSKSENRKKIEKRYFQILFLDSIPILSYTFLYPIVSVDLLLFHTTRQAVLSELCTF